MYSLSNNAIVPTCNLFTIYQINLSNCSKYYSTLYCLPFVLVDRFGKKRIR